MNKMKAKILIADDHAIMRDGLRAALQINDNYAIVAEAGNGMTAYELAIKHQPDIVIMDIKMPKLDGISASKKIKKTLPKVKILMLTMYDNSNYILDALSAGINGYIFKTSKINKMFEAIDKLLSGSDYFDSSVTKFLKEINYNKERRTSTAELVKITKREIEIIKLITEGNTNTEIAENLFISRHTVHNHRRNILHKLNMKNTAELVKFALSNNLI